MRTKTPLFFLLGALLLLSSRQAEASAVKGCKIDATVLDVLTAAKDKKTEVTLKIRVFKEEELGHSAGPASCDKPGTEKSFAVDNDEDVLKAGVKKGDTVRLEWMDVYSMTGTSASHSHSETFVTKIASPTSTPGPTTPTDTPAESPKPTGDKEPPDASAAGGEGRSGKGANGDCSVSSPEVSAPWGMLALVLGALLLARRRS